MEERREERREAEKREREEKEKTREKRREKRRDYEITCKRRTHNITPTKIDYILNHLQSMVFACVVVVVCGTNGAGRERHNVI